MRQCVLTILFSLQQGEQNKDYDFLYLAKNNISEQGERNIAYVIETAVKPPQEQTKDGPKK